MASAPSDLGPVTGRVDREGRLVEADAPLLRLQQEAGSSLGAPLALPQLAAVARSAIKLGVPLSRAVIAASNDQDLDLWLRAEPDADGARLTIEGWKARPPAPPRLTLVGSEPLPEDSIGADALSFRTDSELKITHISDSLAERLGIDSAEAAGDPLTRHFLLSDDGNGMPLLSAVATRQDFSGQRAKLRGKGDTEMTLAGTALLTTSNTLTGYDIEVVLDGKNRQQSALAFDSSLDEALRTPLDRIIAAAERIVDRSEGPLRSDYAAYAGDIAAAGRHLLSVVHSITDQPSPASTGQLDLTACASEAIQLVHPRAEERSIHLELVGADGPLFANAEPRGVVQILVNLLNNAIRHSPDGATVAIIAERRGELLTITVADEGPGIAEADQDRIFERYERADTSPEGSGLGLAISRRLARTMRGDIELQSTPGQGARFTLVLPRA
jgi:signal transduction histidine kinase